MAGKKKRSQRFYDYSLLFTVVFLTIFGLIMIYSASSYKAQIDYDGNAAYFMIRQGLIALGGFVVMLIISKMDYHWYARLYRLAIAVSWILMIAVSLFGREVNGKKRWIYIGSIGFQPTEIVKITVIVALAALITRLGRNVDRLAGLVRAAAIVLPLGAVVAANNLSSGIIICGIGFVMLFVASKKKLPYALCVLAGCLTVAFAGPLGHALESIGLLQEYQLRRINVWLDPEAYPDSGGYQVLQGLYAIGSGGLFGKGLGESIQKLGFVPEAQNDMIFSIICQQRAGSVRVAAGGGRYGPYRYSGDLKYRGGDQYHPQHRHHPAVYQLRRHVGLFPYGGNGHGAGGIQPDQTGKIKNGSRTSAFYIRWDIGI